MKMEFKSGYITLVGVPNAGKSSMVNALVKESVSIVTSKPQTTRKRTLGILTEPDSYQMIFVDTPGVIKSSEGLNPFLQKELDSALKDVDVVVCAIGPWEFKKKEVPWAVQLGKTLKAQPIYVITQADKITKDEQEEILKIWKEWFTEDQNVLLTSSRTRLGLNTLKELILSHLPVGPRYYDVDIFTPQSMREIAAEMIRKQCFEQLHQELPYGLAVMIQSFEEKTPILKISADILVSRESHKPMVIGKGAATLKQIGVRARHELERTFGQKIFLKLHVVAKPGWLKDKTYLQELGYDDV
jgi:GTP-binding protein Era